MQKQKLFKSSDFILAIVMIAIGIFAIVSGAEMGFWVNNRPGTGFMPVISAGILLVGSVVVCITKIVSFGKNKTIAEKADLPIEETHSHDKDIVEEQAEDNEEELRRDTEGFIGRFFAKIMPNPKIRWGVLLTAFTLITIKLIDLFGMIFGLSLFTFIFLKFIGKLSWLKSIMITAAVIVIIYLVFEALLKIPLPRFMNGF